MSERLYFHITPVADGLPATISLHIITFYADLVFRCIPRPAGASANRLDRQTSNARHGVVLLILFVYGGTSQVRLFLADEIGQTADLLQLIDGAL